MTPTQPPQGVMAELRELLARATPGPWEVSGACCGEHGTETVSIYHTDTSKGFRHIHEVVETGCACGDEAVTPDNAALIVAAVNALPGLLDELAILTTGGVIEVAVRNPSVRDYCEHWEGRALAAESRASALLARCEGLEAALREIAADSWSPDSSFCHPEGCESPGIARRALAGGRAP